MIVSDLITGALTDLGVLAQGEVPSADDSAVGLARLNDMLDQWSTQRLNLYTVGSAIYTLTGGKQSYQIGPGAVDFNTARPVLIQTAAIIMPGTTVRLPPMAILSSIKWAALQEKGSSGLAPSKLYPDYAYPISTLNFHSIPSGNIQVEIYSLNALPVFVTLADPVSFPQGYAKALRTNLAINIASAFGAPVDQFLAQEAVGSKAELRAFNLRLLLGSSGESKDAIEAAGLGDLMPQQAPGAPPQG